MSALTTTDFHFPGQQSVYNGKVRDVYNLGDRLVMVATDRISAFDVVLPKGIPFKGQVLNQIAAQFLDATTDICPNWKQATPELEASHARSYGHCRRNLRRFCHRDDRARLSLRQCLARL